MQCSNSTAVQSWKSTTVEYCSRDCSSDRSATPSEFLNRTNIPTRPETRRRKGAKRNPKRNKSIPLEVLDGATLKLLAKRLCGGGVGVACCVLPASFAFLSPLAITSSHEYVCAIPTRKKPYRMCSKEIGDKRANDPTIHLRTRRPVRRRLLSPSGICSGACAGTGAGMGRRRSISRTAKTYPSC